MRYYGPFKKYAGVVKFLGAKGFLDKRYVVEVKLGEDDLWYTRVLLPGLDK